MTEHQRFFTLRNLPNILTVSRIIMIFFFVILANIDASKINFVHIPVEVSDACHLVAYIIAIIAGVTDFFDGRIARKYKCESNFGKLMDPLADKVFATATFVMLSDYRIIPAWIVVVVLTREFLVTGLRLLALSEGVVIAADKSGKFKTAFQMIALIIAGAGWVKWIPLTTDMRLWYPWYVILVGVALMTVYSGCSYFVKNYKLLKKSF